MSLERAKASLKGYYREVSEHADALSYTLESLIEEHESLEARHETLQQELSETEESLSKAEDNLRHLKAVSDHAIEKLRTDVERLTTQLTTEEASPGIWDTDKSRRQIIEEIVAKAAQAAVEERRDLFVDESRLRKLMIDIGALAKLFFA